MPAWPFAAASLPAGFAVAVATGVRPIGGLVMVALAAAALMAPGVRRVRGAVWVVVLLACFAASHALADVIGSWPAVACVTAVAAAAGVVLLDRPAQPAS